VSRDDPLRATTPTDTTPPIRRAVSTRRRQQAISALRLAIVYHMRDTESLDRFDSKPKDLATRLGQRIFSESPTHAELMRCAIKSDALIDDLPGSCISTKAIWQASPTPLILLIQ